MATIPGMKMLRVALIQGSKITEDRTLKKRGPVTVGQDARNTFVVPVSNLPSTFTLFEQQGAQTVLCFKSSMDGKLFVGGQELTLKQAVQQGLAKQAGGDIYKVPLTDASKGRVALGEVSLLFQFVAPPREPPRLELPRDVRGSFFSQVDQFFFGILVASMAIHFSGASFIACQPLPPEREMSLEDLPDRFAKAIMPVEVKKEVKKEEKADKAVAKKEEKKEPEKEAVAEKPATSNKATKEMKEAMSQKGLLKIIGAGSGGDGALADVLGNNTGASSVAAALEGAGGVATATADSLAAQVKGGTAGGVAGIGDLATNVGKVGLQEKADTQIRGKVSEEAPDVESSDVDKNALNKFVRSRKSAIQACYESELKRTPTLKGRIVIRFNIGTNGRTKDIVLEENSLNNDAVTTCIISKVRGWVFPFKPESDVGVSYPFLFAPAS